MSNWWDSIAETAAAMSWLEVAAVAAGLLYVILAARENIWCWLFGALNGLLSVILFAQSKLYAESVLYIYYILAAGYGWLSWRRRGPQDSLPIRQWPWTWHLLGIAGSVGISWMLGWFLMTQTDAQYPIVDAHTTVFSFWATFLVTRKVLENWLYWILIDAVSVGLYSQRQLVLYALLMAVYTAIAVGGWLAWRRHYRDQRAGAG